jgi:osmotically-inducible protein OsmY
VLQALARHGGVAAPDVGVEVDDGVVTLHGTVSSQSKRQAAQDAAYRVPHVRDVANNIPVKLPGIGTPTDTELAQAVRTALELQESIPHRRLRTTVPDGWVTLQGTVDRQSERAAAERAVRGVAGVRGCTSAVTVRAAAERRCRIDGMGVPCRGRGLTHDRGSSGLSYRLAERGVGRRPRPHARRRG